VEGSSLSENGNSVVLRGVDIPSLDSSNEGDHVFRSCRVAIEDWKANCVRLPISQDRWFGKAEEQKGSGDEYRNEIDEIASYVSRSNSFLILSLAWSDAGEWGKNLGTHCMPDSNSVQFWKEAAHKFRGNGKVLFELYAAPHDVDGPTWLSGGPVKEGSLTYQAAGFRDLLSAVRGVGAKNIVLVTPVDVHATLDETNGRGIVLNIPTQTASANRPSLPQSVACCVDVSPADIPNLFDWLKQKGVSWTAKGITTIPPSNLIIDWIYTPSSPWGSQVRAELIRNSN
jgi:hypothetical protein